MKKRILTLAIALLFAMTLLPLTGFTAVAATTPGLERVDLPAIDPASKANNNDSNQMGWATEGFEDEGAEADVEASAMQRAVYLALKMPEMPGFMQFILQTPMGWWQQEDYDGDALANFWNESESVLRLPFTGDWDPDDVRAKLQIAYYDDGVMDLGITDQWLECYPEVEEGDLIAIRLPGPGFEANNNDDTQMGWATEGFEGENTPLDFPAMLAARATHLVLEMPEAPGFLQFILQTPAGWWQQVDMGGDDLAGYYDDGKLYIPFVGDWDPADVRAKVQLGYYDDGIMDLGITGAWLLMGPEVELAPPEPPRELPPVGSLPLELGLGQSMWGDTFTQLGWNGDTRAIDQKMPFDGGGLTAGLMLEANWFVIYVDNAPDDEIAEMIQLGIFGNANGWGWDAGRLEAPTIQLYDTFVPGAIAFPFGGHPYVEAIRAAGEDELENRNFAFYFQYEGGIENLGITSVMLYAELPVDAAPEPPPAATPAPATPAPTPTPAEPTSGGFPVWGIVVLIVGGAAVVAVVVVTVIKKKKA